MILIVPCCEPGKGGGHLSRCIALTKDLHAMGKKARLFITPQTRDLTNLYKSHDFNPSWCITNEELEIRQKLESELEFVILDNFKTTLEEITHWKNFAPVIGIDEVSAFREEFDYLIDILIPRNFIKPAANITSPKLLIKNITKRRADSSARKDKILISFGQEDTAGLGLKTAQTLSEMEDSQYWDITLLKGALSGGLTHTPKNVKVLDNIPKLAERLHEYDLVITHYGLTAYEALYAGTRVLLDHPTPLHKELAKTAGFETFSGKSFSRTSNRRFRGGTEDLLADNNIKENLSALVNRLKPIVNKSCPVCGSEKKQVISRLSDRTYKRCKKCGVIYMDRINEPPIEYEKEYFFESYKKQYGKTYLDDFENIKQNSKNRLKIIKFLRGSVPPCEGISEPTLLDIGCAYGPFLAAAKEEGFSPTGIDPAQDAVKYVNEKLGIPAIHSMFPVSLSDTFDVITLWYVIEHFKDCVSVLSEIKKLLKPDGILAFSTPSFSGISGCASLENFLSASPADHFTIWSPKKVRKALAISGFKVKKIVVVGHHPERFPALGKLAKSKKGLVYSILLAYSKLFGLGDTFEVYAVKVD